MNKLAKALATAGALAAIPLGIAGPASAATHASAPSSPGNHGWAYVKVCQKVWDYDWHYDYYGDYGIRDTHGHNRFFQLSGGYDCQTFVVKPGWINVYVYDTPDHTRLDSHDEDSYWFKARPNHYYKVTFDYHDWGSASKQLPKAS